MAIYKHDDSTYSVSSHQVWLPGCYESERAAKYSFRFSDEVLSRLQDEANLRSGVRGGTITFEDLQLARKRLIDKYTLRPITND